MVSPVRLILLLIALLGTAVAALLVGPVGFNSLVVTEIRLPRVLMCALVGGALAVAGAAMQAVFSNPLAEPGITGVGAGAATFAVLAIIMGWTAIMPVGAFLGALLATFVVQAAGRSVSSILLVGVALNSFLGAVIAAMVANAPNAEQARSAMFWLNGDLTGRTMDDVTLVLAPILIGVAGVVVFYRELNMLSLGGDTAQSSGVAVKKVSHVVLAFGAIATAGAVATCGVISFVGLVVPHLIRLVAGANHKFLLPASFLVGGTFLTVADTCARMMFDPITLQTGVVTALVGAPFLLFLVMRRAHV